MMLYVRCDHTDGAAAGYRIDEDLTEKTLMNNLLLDMESDKQTYQAYELSNLLQFGDSETILTLTQMFETIVPESLTHLWHSVVERDWDKVHSISHKLRGTLGVIQIHSIVRNMSVVEAWAKNGENLDEILPLVDASIADYHTHLPSIKAAIAKELSYL